MPLPKSNTYTIEDIYALPEGKRAEHHYLYGDDL